MALSATTVARHELVGLRAAVTDAPNPDLVGLAGRVVDETMRTLRIEASGLEKTIPKTGAIIEFALPDGDRVAVEGDRLVARPARRTETGGGSIWHSD